jgi:hypothetical protein
LAFFPFLVPKLQYTYQKKKKFSPMAASRLSRLPRWISHWLGYRPETPTPLPTWQIAAWSFIAAFCGLSVVQGIFNYSDYFKERNVPGIIASYVSLSSFDKSLATPLI